MAAVVGGSVLVDSVQHRFNITDYQDIESPNNVVFEHFRGRNLDLEWLIQVDPAVQRDEGLLFELTVGLKTRVDGLRCNVKAFFVVIGAGNQTQEIPIGEGQFVVGREVQQNGIVFPLILAAVGTPIEGALKVPKFREVGNRTTVRVCVKVNVYRDIL